MAKSTCKPRRKNGLRQKITLQLKGKIEIMLEWALAMGLKRKEAVTAVEEAAINWEYGN